MTDPIDATPQVPPPVGVDTEHLTQDIVSALERAVLLLVERKVRTLGIGRRRAAVEVLAELRAL